MLRLIRDECALRENKDKLPEKKTRLKTLREERAGLAKQMPKAASPDEKRVQEELQQKRTALAAAQQEVAANKQKTQKIVDIRTRLATARAQAARWDAELATLLAEVGVPEGDRAAFKLMFSGDTESPLHHRSLALAAAIAAKLGDEEKPAAGTIRALEREIKVLAEKESADKARQERIKKIQTRLVAIDTETKRIEAEIAQIEGPEKTRLASAREDRLTAYGRFFENLRREQEGLRALYEPVKKRLTDAAGTAKGQELEFSIRWQVNLDEWIEHGSVLFDQRRSNPFGTIPEMAKAAQGVLVPSWTSGDPEAVKTAFTEFFERFTKIHPREYLRAGITVKELLEWLYGVDHIRLNYGLKFNKTELEKLSPGTKGIVLLILYLGMDTADTRPLVVDQPDENLDSESIYELLTEYFKNAKTRRQVILITHNPNLVVNADSEQVLVATCVRQDSGLPHITYATGALENDRPGEGMRQRACRILEGGKDAFLKRESRYAIVRS
jgi:hypothetical protein